MISGDDEQLIKVGRGTQDNYQIVQLGFSHYGRKKCILPTPRVLLQMYCNARYKAAMLDVMLAIFHDTLSPFYLCNCSVSGASQTAEEIIFLGQSWDPP